MTSTRSAVRRAARLMKDGAEPLDDLQHQLGHMFADIELLRGALVHTSYVNEMAPPRPESNERLEFLGDAVLELVVAERLYISQPHLPEGDLTTLRAGVVRLEMLGALGLRLELGRYLSLGRGEEGNGGRTRASIVGRALEAVLGAIYLDGGLEAARDATLRLIDPEIDQLAASQALKDDKSRLQEASQGELGLTPLYQTVAESGPDYEKEFTVEVSLGDTSVGRGSGRTKQIAAQAAAQDALSHWPPEVTSARETTRRRAPKGEARGESVHSGRSRP